MEPHPDRRAIFNALRWLMHNEAPWRYLPGGFPPWEAVYQQSQRGLQTGCFEAKDLSSTKPVIRFES